MSDGIIMVLVFGHVVSVEYSPAGTLLVFPCMYVALGTIRSAPSVIGLARRGVRTPLVGDNIKVCSVELLTVKDWWIFQI